MDFLQKFKECAGIRVLLEEYRRAMEKNEIEDFNVFTITSDLYYRENYHSDVLAAILRYQDPASGRYILLEQFLEMLKISRKEGKEINIDAFKNPIIEREPHRIDILIREDAAKSRDVKPKHCIIIENKINDAPDMERQLPRYFEEMKERGYEVEAIVYLTKYPNIQPDKVGWKSEDIKIISPLLIPVHIKGNNLSHGLELISDWIDVCINEVGDIDVLSALRQYRQLLCKITNKYIGMESKMKLLEEIRNSQPSTFEEVVVFKDMLDKLPSAMKEELNIRLSESWGKEFKVGGWSDPTFCVITLKDEKTIFIHCTMDAAAPYKVYCADFSNVDHQPKWLTKIDFTWELKEFAKNRIIPDVEAKIGFQFGLNEVDNMMKLIEVLVSIYKSTIQ